MTPIDDVIRELQAARATYLHNIQRIDDALEALGKSAAVDTLFSFPVRRLGARDAILEAFAEQTDAVLDVAATFEAVTRIGWATSSGNPRNTVASTLAKLAKEGLLEKVGNGTYRLAAADRELALA